MRRVVVTGLGLVTPLGTGVEHSWKGLVEGRSGIRPITAFDTEGYGCTIAGEVPSVDGRGGGGPDVPGSFDPDAIMSPKERKRVDDFILFGIAAADEALNDANWHPETDEDKERTGVMMGAGIGGLGPIADSARILADSGPRRISPFFIPSALINLASGQISIRHQLKGPNHAVVTACASGVHAIGDAARMIAFDDADVMVAGGAESSIVPLGIAGFLACKALCTAYNDTPEAASRPYDAERDRFVLSEGAVVFVLEEREHALARGARIYAELAGYGASADAFHLSSLAPGAEGSARAMRSALADAGLSASAVDYVSAHATSTPGGDGEEAAAIATVFAENKASLHVSGVKSMTGHLLGAAGAMGAFAAVKAIATGVVPPTINLGTLDPAVAALGLNVTPNVAVRKLVRAALANSFGFGGTNCSLVFTAA